MSESGKKLREEMVEMASESYEQGRIDFCVSLKEALNAVEDKYSGHRLTIPEIAALIDHLQSITEPDSR